jgi:hypothetical protein
MVRCRFSEVASTPHLRRRQLVGSCSATHTDVGDMPSLGIRELRRETWRLESGSSAAAYFARGVLPNDLPGNARPR